MVAADPSILPLKDSNGYTAARVAGFKHRDDDVIAAFQPREDEEDSPSATADKGTDDVDDKTDENGKKRKAACQAF